MKNPRNFKIDCLSQLEDIQKDLLSSLANYNSTLSERLLKNLLTKINIAIQVISFNPRLPLFQIEERITEICKLDKSTHGVIVKILFTTKFGEIDNSRLAYLNVNI